MHERCALAWILIAVLALPVGCAGAMPTPAVEATPAPTQQPGCQSITPAPGVAFEKSSQSFPPMNTFQVALGDLDGDGDLDAVMAHAALTGSHIWLNDGRGCFTSSGQALTPQGHGVGVGDLDNDGDLDIFVSYFGDGSNEVWFNRQP